MYIYLYNIYIYIIVYVFMYPPWFGSLEKTSQNLEARHPFAVGCHSFLYESPKSKTCSS